MAKRKREMTITERQPVAVAFFLGVIPVLASFVLGVLHTSGTSVPTWVIAALAGVGSLTTAIGAVWSRAQVMPLAKYRRETRSH